MVLAFNWTKRFPYIYCLDSFKLIHIPSCNTFNFSSIGGIYQLHQAGWSDSYHSDHWNYQLNELNESLSDEMAAVTSTSHLDLSHCLKRIEFSTRKPLIKTVLCNPILEIQFIFKSIFQWSASRTIIIALISCCLLSITSWPLQFYSYEIENMIIAIRLSSTITNWW